jgi:glucose/arabinose dehydrogenase
MRYAKHFINISVLAIALLGFVFALNFYFRGLRGVGPALKAPSGDIAEEIGSGQSPLQLPTGFSISIFAKDLPGPRVLAWGPDGYLIVSSPSSGKVFSLPDRNGDGKADENVVIAEGLNRPHGLATRCTERCELYIAETDQVAVYDYDAAAMRVVNKRKIIDLPAGGNHYSRTILFMPSPEDHRLLISVGSSCNVCNEADVRRAKVLVSNADGSDLKVFASGLRNSVFMAIHLVTGKIWATEMGRDLLGDDLPPDEINILEEGKFYGWPTCYGKNIHDDDFDKNVYFRNPCMEPFEIPSYIDIPAHSAPLGIAFIPEEGWPQEYWYHALVAYHGSWNRSVPTGYKIVRYKLDYNGNYIGEDDFITGWLKDGEASGRPVDILIQPGGILYISDDKAGVVYRVVYQRPDYSKAN